MYNDIIMPKQHLITGQRVAAEKLAQARKFRANMTPSEVRLWSELRGNRLDGYHFRRQQLIAGFIVDFYCHPARLVIEIDGGIHAIQPEADAHRQQALEDLGLCVLRFSSDAVMTDLPAVLMKIRKMLSEIA